MAQYEAKTESRLTFNVTHEGQTVGRLSYKSWFRFDAEITTGNTVYQVAPKGFWGTTIELREGEKILLKFKMNWNGEIVIHTYFDGAEKDYLFRHSGIFKESFVLKDQQGTELLVMKPQLKWTLMSHEYQITATDTFEALDKNRILLLSALHCANYYMSMMVSAMG